MKWHQFVPALRVSRHMDQWPQLAPSFWEQATPVASRVETRRSYQSRYSLCPVPPTETSGAVSAGASHPALRQSACAKDFSGCQARVCDNALLKQDSKWSSDTEHILPAAHRFPLRLRQL